MLATTIVGPVEWIRAYGWRDLDPVELQALANLTTRFGELMGITGLPTTYDGYLTLLRDYEQRRFEFTEANRRVTEATLRIAAEVAPPPLQAARPAGHDRPDGRAAAGRARDARAAGVVRRPPYAAACGSAPACCGSRHRAARRTTTGRPPTPTATRCADIGPLSMLDDLDGPPADRRDDRRTAAASGAIAS